MYGIHPGLNAKENIDKIKKKILIALTRRSSSSAEKIL